MAKMASLHAEQYTSSDDNSQIICKWCGDTLDVCAEAEECPAGFTR